MENENEVIVTPTEEVTTTETTTEPKKDFVETPEAKRARLQRQLEQHNKKYPVVEEESTKKSKSNDLDYGQKAYLVANGIKGADETKLVQDIMSNTGKSLDEILESKYFQSELKELREDMASKNAVVTDSKRTNQTTDDSVEYWLAKGELPPESERELRLKVVNARLKKEGSGNAFTSNSVVK